MQEEDNDQGADNESDKDGGGKHSPPRSGAGASKTPLTAKEVRAMNFWSICKRFDASMGMGLSKKSPTKKSDVKSPRRKMMERGGQHCSLVMLCYDVKEKKMRGEVEGRSVFEMDDRSICTSGSSEYTQLSSLEFRGVRF